MRRVPIDELRTGDRLGRDVYASPDAPPLLRAGVRVSDSYCASLQRAGIPSVWIDDAISEGIEPLEVLEDTTKRRAAVAIRDAFQQVSTSLPRGGSLSPRVVEDMAEVAELIIRDIARNVHSALALNDLANADGYTLKHSLAVTTLGLSLGLRVMAKHGWIDAIGKRRFDRLEERLIPLGIGLLLHDIGKLAVPQEILRKPGPLTPEEWKTMRGHSMFGVDILRKAEGICPLARSVVRSHHERWDGSGYPEGRSGDQIHQFARIAAVSDVFDALTSDRSYRKAMPPHEGYDFVVGRSSADFDPDVVAMFRSSVAPYPPGTRVVLSDGYCALVKEVRPDAVATPIVRVVMDPSGALVPMLEIDLSVETHLKIVSTTFELPVPEPA
jgi:HD-GYP domain-containing protein (c-di-GMP phosphodiesterase class II)